MYRGGGFDSGMANASYHVVARSNGNWSVRRQGAARMTRSYPTKQAAINGGRELVVSSGGGSLVIHERDGRVSSRASVSPPPVNGNRAK